MAEKIAPYWQRAPIPEALRVRHKELAQFAGQVTHTKGSLIFVSFEHFHKPHPASDSNESVLLRQATPPVPHPNKDSFIALADHLALEERRMSIRLVELQEDNPQHIVDARQHQLLAEFSFTGVTIPGIGEVTEDDLVHTGELVEHIHSNLMRPHFLPHKRMPAVESYVSRFAGVSMIDLNAADPHPRELISLR